MDEGSKIAFIRLGFLEFAAGEVTLWEGGPRKSTNALFPMCDGLNIQITLCNLLMSLISGF